MPRYFFDLASPGFVERDDVGVEFKDLDVAYLDACRAVFEISEDMVRERLDPSRLRFDIRDAGGRPLLDVPFNEVLKPSRCRPPSKSPGVHADIAMGLTRQGELKAQLRVAVAQAEATFDRARETVRRARGG